MPNPERRDTSPLSDGGFSLGTVCVATVMYQFVLEGTTVFM